MYHVICPGDLSGLEPPSAKGGMMRRTEVLQGMRQMKFEEVLERTKRHQLTQEEAASMLGLPERTFRRRRDRFAADGAVLDETKQSGAAA